MPAGHGKSRIIVAVIELYKRAVQLKGKNLEGDCITVVFNDAKLQELDRETIESTARKNDVEVKFLVAAAGQTLTVGAGQVYLLDEADDLLIDKEVVLKTSAGGVVIGFTATPVS